MEKAHHVGQAPARRLLLVRLLLLLVGGVLLVLLSSRPAGAAERQGSGLLDPVGGTLAAATEPIGSLARGAAGTVSSTVGRTAGVARRTVASPRRSAARPAVGSTSPARQARATRRGAPAATSPVRRTAPPTRSIARPLPRAAGADAGSSADRLAGLLAPVNGPLDGALAPAGSVLDWTLAPVTRSLDPLLGPLSRQVGPVLPDGLLPVELPLPDGLLTPRTAPSTSRAGPVADLLTDPASAGPALIVPPAGPRASPATARSRTPVGPGGRHDPASLALGLASGVPVPAELPMGQDAVSGPSAAGMGLAALAGALLLFGLRRHGRALAERSGTRTRSCLPLVAPA